MERNIVMLAKPLERVRFYCCQSKMASAFCLSTVNLSKFDELGHSSNFDKWPPNLIESDPRPLERIIMHFWPKLATHEVSGHPMNDPLPTQKNGQKIFFRPEMVKLGLVEISAPPKSTFLGRGGRNFFRPAPKGFQSPRKKFLMPTEPFWGSGDLPESKTAEIRPKNAILQKFLHPQNRPFWGGVVEIFSALYQRGPKGLLKVFLWYLTHSWSLQACQSQKSLILGQKTEISESHFGRNFCMWVSGPPQKIFLN